MIYKLMDVLDTSNDTIIYDPISIDWSTFLWNEGYYTHRMSRHDILKPYYISFTYYGTSIYEDIILLLNNIEHVWDLIPEQEIRIPKLSELQKFLKDNTK